MSQGPYPRYILLQVDGPGSKREVAEGETLKEVTEKAAAQAGQVEPQVPEEWNWHPLHPDNPLQPENRQN